MIVLIVLGIWIVSVILIMLFFKGAAENEQVILRPLDMNKSNLDINLFDEIRKCTEEDDEFFKGVIKYDIDNVIEEFWDSVQTKLNVMSMMGIPTDVIYKDLNKHIKKMYEREYVFKE